MGARTPEASARILTSDLSTKPVDQSPGVGTITRGVRGSPVRVNARPPDVRNRNGSRLAPSDPDMSAHVHTSFDVHKCPDTLSENVAPTRFSTSDLGFSGTYPFE